MGGIVLSDVTYTTVPGKIDAVLAKIKSNGVPKKVDTVWLKAIGFTSSNDKTLLPVLKNIDFIDGGKAPTERWRKFRGVDGDIALGEAIRHGYDDLYAFYDDAHERSISEIANVFKTKSSAGDQAISKAVSTFKALAAQAKFTTPTQSKSFDSGTPEQGSASANPPETPVRPATAGGSTPSLHIDLQVHISPEATAEQIDKIFASMAKHLYRKAD
jgi:hypothetical protein